MVGWFGAQAPAASFPEIEISRATSEHEWAFAINAGALSCVAIGAQRVVIFSEPWPDEPALEQDVMVLPRSVIVSANPFALLASVEDRSLYLPFDSLETLIRRLAPFEAMGTKLCDDDAARLPQQPN